MIAKASIIRLTQIILALLIPYLALYSFLHTSLYDYATESLQHFLLGTTIQSIESNIKTLITSSLIIIVTVIGLFTVLFGKLKDVRCVYYLSILLYVPSVMAYSNIDWSQIYISFISWLGVQDTHPALLYWRKSIFLLLETKTELPLYQVLAVGILIFIGYWVLFYTSFSREFRDEMLDREGKDDDVNNGVFKQWVYEVVFIVFSGGISFVIIFLSMSLKGFLNIFLGMFSSFYLIAGAAYVVIASACIIIFLYSLDKEVRISRKKESFFDKESLTAEISEYTIHRFIKERGGTTSKMEIYKALGGDAESRRSIDEKLRMMERYELIIIDEDKVRLR